MSTTDRDWVLGLLAVYPTVSGPEQFVIEGQLERYVGHGDGWHRRFWAIRRLAQELGIGEIAQAILPTV